MRKAHTFLLIFLFFSWSFAHLVLDPMSYGICPVQQQLLFLRDYLDRFTIAILKNIFYGYKGAPFDFKSYLDALFDLKSLPYPLFNLPLKFGYLYIGMAPAVGQRIFKRPPQPFRRGPMNKVCTFWLEGRCTRRPCKFLHAVPSESAPAAAVVSKQNQFRGRTSSRTWKRNPEEDEGRKSSRNLEEAEGRKSSRNPEEAEGRKSSRNPEEGKGGGVKIDSFAESECHDIKRVEEKLGVCQAWLSGNCMLSDKDCQYLHAWSYGSGFSLLAKLNGHNDAVTGITLPSESDKLYSGGRDKTVRIWDCHTGLCVDTLEMSSEVCCLKSEGPWLFVGLKNAVKAWNTQKSSEALTLPTAPVPVGEVHAIAAMDDMLFAGTQGGTIFAWKFRCEDEIPEQAASLKGHSHAVISLIIGSGILCSSSMDNTIRVWDRCSLLCVQTLEGHTGAVMSVLCWDRYLLSCSLDGTVKAWGRAKGDKFELEMLYSREEEDRVLNLRRIQDAGGKRLLLCLCNDNSVRLFNDNSVRLYDLPLFAERGRLFSKGEVRVIETSSEAGLFFTGDATGQVTVWKLAGSEK